MAAGSEGRKCFRRLFLTNLLRYAVFLYFTQIGCVTSLSKHPLLLVVSFDGFWYGYLEHYKNVIPNILELANLGVQAPGIKNAFITKTFPNHYSIATGLYEESHGMVANNFYDPVFNETFEMNDTDAKWWDSPNAFPIWVLNQQTHTDRHSGGMMWPGTDALIKNQTAFHVATFNDNISWENRVDTVIKWFKNETAPANCVFLYIEEPDEIGHKFGPFSSEMAKILEKVDKLVKYLIDALKKADLFSKVNIVLTSDHGMSEVKSNHLIDLSSIVNLDTFDLYMGTPVFAVYPKQGQENEVYEKLKNGSQYYNFTVYKKDEIPDDYHYKNNYRIGPIILVADEGYDIYPHLNNITEIQKGDHGYNNSFESMHPFFIAHGPAFRSGVVMKTFNVVDLYPLFCHILHLVPKANNGSLTNVIGMLRDPFGLHITDTWLIVICSVLGICILIGIIALSVSNNRARQVDQLDSGHYVYRALQPGKNRKRTEEENQYLLVPSATDEL